MIDWEPLVAAAREVRDRAHTPHSGFAVGAALLTEGDEIVAGCNVENRHLPLSICAERNALSTAVAGGSQRPRALAVVTDSSPPTPPCGQCLETLREFAPDLPILAVGRDGEQREHRLSELLPHPFRIPET